MNRIKVIFAMGQNGEFCNDRTGKLPWGDKPLPSDSKHFQAFTKGNVVVMGRHTWESLPAPLKGRVNIVLSNTEVLPINGQRPDRVYSGRGDLEGFINIIRNNYPDKDICFIGGEQVIYAALKYADIVSITVVGEDYPECRKLDPRKFDLVKDAHPYTIEYYHEDDGLELEISLFFRKDPYMLAMNIN